MALVSVALVVSGIVQTVREVASPTALVSTTYGWLLIAKVSLVLVALGAVVAPPDAIAASALGRRLGLPRRVATLLERSKTWR